MKANRSRLLAGGMFLAAIFSSPGQPAIIEFARSQFSVSENAGRATITLQRSGNLDEDVEVAFATSDGTATTDHDYTPVSGILGFGPGQTNQTFTVPILRDALGEGDETVRLELSACWGCFGEIVLGARSNAVLTIVDSGRVEFSPAVYMVDEAPRVAVITVVGGSDSGSGFSVDYSSDGCSATAGLDYLPQSGMLNFAPGETEKTIVIPIIDDTVAEEEETVKVRLSHPIGVMLGALSNAVLRIRDNDPPSEFGEGTVPRRVGIWPTIPGAASAIVVLGNYAYVVAGDGIISRLQVIDVSDPANPRRVGGSSTLGPISGVAVSEHFAYLSVRPAGGFALGGLDVIDISDPRNLIQVGLYNNTGGDAYGVAVLGNYAYVADAAAGLLVIDVSNPANPQRAGRYSNYGASGVAVCGNTVYLASVGSNSLEVIDVADPKFPLRVGGYSAPSLYAQRVAVSGNYCYLLGGDQLQIIDIHDPANPQKVGSYAFNGYAADMAVSGGFAYVVESYGTNDDFVVLDLSQPSNPQHVGSYQTGMSFGVAVWENYAFVTHDAGVDSLDISVPTNVVRVGGIASMYGPKDVAVSGDYVYVADGPDGLRTINATDMANPRLIGRAATTGGAVGVAIVCDHAYVATGGGVEAFDISQSSNPQRVGTYLDFGGGSSALAVEAGRAYLAFPSCSCCPPPHMDVIDISNPANPRLMGVYDIGIGRVARDLTASDAYVYAALGSDGLSVIDVTDSSNPRTVGRVLYLPALDMYIFSERVVVAGRHLYVLAEAVPQHGPDRFYGLFVFDISDLANPQHLGGYPLTGGSSNSFQYFPGFAVAGGYAFVVGDAGLEVIDVRAPANPRQFARYPTEPGPVAVSDGYAYIANGSGLEIIDLHPLGFRPSSITRLADGKVQFILNTRYGRRYTVQASTNLVHWESLEPRIASGTQLIITDTNAPVFSRRFYRAASP